MKTEWNNLDAFMAENLNEFKPFAYFDKHMDCVRVKFQDCSVTEVRLNRFLTVLKPNHNKSNGIAGFTIKGFAYLFNGLGWSKDNPYKVAELLNAIVSKYPDGESIKLKKQVEGNSACENLLIHFADFALN